MPCSSLIKLNVKPLLFIGFIPFLNRNELSAARHCAGRCVQRRCLGEAADPWWISMEPKDPTWWQPAADIALGRNKGQTAKCPTISALNFSKDEIWLVQMGHRSAHNFDHCSDEQNNSLRSYISSKTNNLITTVHLGKSHAPHQYLYSKVSSGSHSCRPRRSSTSRFLVHPSDNPHGLGPWWIARWSEGNAMMGDWT